jgi:hypothetical protein
MVALHFSLTKAQWERRGIAVLNNLLMLVHISGAARLPPPTNYGKGV